MANTIRIKMYVDTGFPTACHEDYHEVDKDEWEAMTKDEKDSYLEEVAKEYMGDCIDYGAYLED